MIDEQTAVTRRPRRLKLIVGAALILVGLATLFVWAASRPGAVAFFVTPSELAGRVSELTGRNVRMSGAIIPGSVQQGGPQIRFVVAQGAVRVPVTYSGAVPYTFKSTWETKGWEVVVEGRVLPGPSIRAKNVFVRHPPEMKAQR